MEKLFYKKYAQKKLLFFASVDENFFVSIT